ncbi:MAG: methionyl-tRNA formyltransferase [Burkholderiaceae bacterium]|jgi:methionyl-tRNA formyltransferase|nr:methionyl-tRNA formyltransferase [Burkholderiaceae bacterium]
MRIAIIGQHRFGQAVLEAFFARGDEVAGVFVAPEKKGAPPDALRLSAQEHKIPVFQFDSLAGKEAENTLRGLRVDLGVMAYVLQFAPQHFVNIPQFGTIQYHPSLLPKHRGPSSINWPIVCGETETGLTIFRPTDGLDEGPIILQEKIAILPDDTLRDVYHKQLFPMGVNAMLAAADLVVAGKHQEIVQDEREASYEGWFRASEARINWNTHVSMIYNLIRGSNPSPGAWTTLAGEKVSFLDARKVLFFVLPRGNLPVGTIVSIEADRFRVVARGGYIDVLSVRGEGGKVMSAVEYVYLNDLRPGSRFGDLDATCAI